MGGQDIKNVDWNRIAEFAWRILVLVVAVAVILVVSRNWTRWEGGPGWQRTNDAYLQADLTPIIAKVGGYLRSLPVQDFQRVHAGEVLAQLVDDDYRAAVVQAEATVAADEAQSGVLKAQHELQRANIDAARAAVASTEAAQLQNERDLTRQRSLLETGSSSTLHAQLVAQLAQNRAQALAAQRQLSVLDSQLAQSEAATAGARAALATAKLNLSYTTIIAPQDGVIAQRAVKPGQMIGVGTQITTLSPLPHVWVIANYKETQLTHVAVGQKVDISVDTFPGHVLHGHVQSFAPASGASFALLPPDNATGNFTKIVQRIAVKILIDDTDGLTERLLPGMSVETSIDARDGARR
jgi:membrane fusion protein (multidrug efflux system)